jgi:hypothetical protein
MAELYAATPSSDLEQGDVLTGIPFVLIPPFPLKIAKPAVGNVASIEEIKSLGDFEEGEGKSALVDVFLRRVMIISQSCDILHREVVAVCPVYSIEEYKTRIMQLPGWDEAKAKKRIDDDISQRKTNYLFYLPPAGSFPASVADFQYINTVDKEFLKIENRVLSLSDLGRNVLSHGLLVFFSRPAI